MFRRGKDSKASSKNSSSTDVTIAAADALLLQCCPLPTEVYHQARTFTRPATVSRIRTTIGGILSSHTAQKHFEAFLAEETPSAVPLFGLLLAAHTLATKAPSLDQEAASIESERLLQQCIALNARYESGGTRTESSGIGDKDIELRGSIEPGNSDSSPPLETTTSTQESTQQLHKQQPATSSSAKAVSKDSFISDGGDHHQQEDGSMFLCEQAQLDELATTLRQNGAEAFARQASALLGSKLAPLVPLFIGSSQHAQQCVDILTQPDLALEDIVYNDDALAPFMQFLDANNAGVLIHFWLLADNFTQTSGNISPKQLAEDAQGIFRQFFSEEAFQPLPIRDDMKAKIGKAVTSKKGVSPSVFEDVERAVYTAMRLYFFPRFCDSDLFAKYVHDFQQKALSSHQTTGSDLGSVVPASHVQGAAVVRDGEYAPSVEKTEALSAGGAVVITRRFSTGLLCYGFVSPYGVFVHDEHNAADASLVDDHILLWAAARSTKGKLHIGKSKTPQEILSAALESAREIVDGVLACVRVGNATVLSQPLGDPLPAHLHLHEPSRPSQATASPPTSS